MNERIRQLVKKAVEAVDIVTGNEALDDELAKMYIPNCFAEKFAELIVKECSDIADKSNQGSKSSNEGTEFYYNADIGDKIKQYFGVI